MIKGGVSRNAWCEHGTMSVRVEQGAVTVVTIDRPDVHNAVDTSTADALESAVREFDRDDTARVLVLTGSGDVAFCAGADLKDPPRLRPSGPMGLSRLEVGKPTIAAVNGYCFAGGLELACWCDWRVGDESATFGVLNRRWGVPLIDGGTQRLPQIVGMSNALYLIETGAHIDAATALRIGLTQEAVPLGTAMTRAREIAERIADYPQASLLADRHSTLAADGIEAEARRGEATLDLPEMVAGLERFRAGDRPAPPE